MIANETTLSKRLNDPEINNCRSQYGLQQWTNPIPHSFKSPKNDKCKTIQTRKLMATVVVE